ncbi:MAG: (R)-phenyllactate dehydratase activator [Syntrophomonadaceae bacterium]|nr:(R)-phenyllactate dehydratase activator [Bacillota bacterium]
MTLTMGVDLGSITAKCVLLQDGCRVLADCVVKGGMIGDGAQKAVTEALHRAGAALTDIAYTVATGYGRVIFAGANEEMSEIGCHGKGAYFQEPEARTVIDIGGQDAKVIRLGAGGRVSNFAMNEKCAAGTGRFLEVMAQALSHPVAELARLGSQATGKVSISSTCTVFAESEVISSLAAGCPVADIVAGIHESIARRIAGLAYRVGPEEKILVTGGVAQNRGVVSALAEKLGCELLVPQFAQTNGALGAALYAFEKFRLAADHVD